VLSAICLQCFDAVGWAAGRASIRPVKTVWWGAGVVVCLEQGADNSITYTVFFIPDYQFQEVFLCFLR